MNIKSKIHEVFPTPVYVSNIDRPYNEGEISLITETEKNTYLNTGNKTSNDLYILNNPLLLKLKNNFYKRRCKTLYYSILVKLY